MYNSTHQSEQKSEKCINKNYPWVPNGYNSNHAAYYTNVHVSRMSQPNIDKNVIYNFKGDKDEKSIKNKNKTI